MSNSSNESELSPQEKKELNSREAARKAMYNHGTRKTYEKLAEQCAAAVAAGDKPAVTKLMAEKQQAFAAWWKATASERKASKKQT